MRFLNRLNYDFRAQRAEANSGEKLTVPGESMTVQEMYKRLMNGQRIPDTLSRVGTFGEAEDEKQDFDSMDLEKFRDLDLAEREEIVNANREKLRQQASFLKRKRKAVADGGIEDADGGNTEAAVPAASKKAGDSKSVAKDRPQNEDAGGDKVRSRRSADE